MAWQNEAKTLINREQLANFEFIRISANEGCYTQIPLTRSNINIQIDMT